jgi:hypothetical protein
MTDTKQKELNLENIRKDRYLKLAADNLGECLKNLWAYHDIFYVDNEKGILFGASIGLIEHLVTQLEVETSLVDGCGLYKDLIKELRNLQCSLTN